MSELIESLRKCKVEGNIVSLPPMSEGPLANYGDVRNALLKAGAKYKKNTFVFPNDAQPYIDRLCGGESLNFQKETQFFPTPDHLADKLVDYACIRPGMSVLEPSAGQGAIIEAIYRAFPVIMQRPSDTHSVAVDYCELSDINAKVLSGKRSKIDRWKGSTSCIGTDFLKFVPDHKYLYDRIVANPPFSKNQDIDHIRKMWECLKPGGRIVTIASKHWQFANNKKETAFREWLNELGVTPEDVPAGEFSESGTKIATCILIIDKP